MDFVDFDKRVVRLADAWLADHREQLGETLRVVESHRQLTDAPLVICISRESGATGNKNVEAEIVALKNWLNNEFCGDECFFRIVVAAEYSLLDQTRLARESAEREFDIKNFRSVKLGGGKND